MENTAPFQIVRYRHQPEDFEVVHSARSPYELLGWALSNLKVSWLDRSIYCIRDARTGNMFFNFKNNNWCPELDILDDIVEAAKDADYNMAYDSNRAVWG